MTPQDEVGIAIAIELSTMRADFRPGVVAKFHTALQAWVAKRAEEFTATTEPLLDHEKSLKMCTDLMAILSAEESSAVQLQDARASVENKRLNLRAEAVYRDILALGANVAQQQPGFRDSART